MVKPRRIPLSRRSGNAVLPKRLTTLTGSGQSQDEWVTLQTEPQPLFEGDTLTLRCLIHSGSTVQWVYFYKDNTELKYEQFRELRVHSVSKSHEGFYKCSATWWSKTIYSAEVRVSQAQVWPSLNSQYSKALRIQVHELPQPALTREPSGEIFEGDAVTLSCVVEEGSGGWRYLWYKDSESSPPVYQTDSSSGTGAGYTIGAAALSHSGEYWCRAERERTSLNSQYSHPIWVNVTALFSRVTLTASPGATVKEAEALNLTCEAAVNNSPHPQLHYTIVRDGEPVTNSTNSALYSITSTEKSNTGSYTCAVESQGVRKSSQELHIEVQTSWHSAVAVGYRVSFFLIHLTVFTLLLLRYCRIQGYMCIPGVKSR
ncbi:Fc receptor-like protein 6 [Acipenser ruthenus]|uniref:Fc receptor-like protein 6 n=1 Tax=Acipenser ruthenus TaxID=7906 RepID=UPI002741F5C0|nr:Fc receptor-like protein 6 [Acipenser ruthenus]